MIVEGQTITVKWNNTNKEWYISKGYAARKRNAVFDVPVEDLYHGSSERIKIKCDYCGCIYEAKCCQVFRNRRNVSKDCCYKCRPKKISDGTRRKRSEVNIRRAKDACELRGYELITTVDEYRGVKMQAKFNCPVHGEQTMMLENIIRGHQCKQCSYEKRGQHLTTRVEDVIDAVKAVNGNELLNPGEFKDVTVRNLRIRCSCGKEFVTSFVNYTKANKTRCSACAQSISVAETKIMRFLDDNHIEYIREKRFDGCRDKRELPFDFYIPSHNLIIEYDGRHHYLPIRGDDVLTYTQRHDRIKDEFCREHGIEILRIPFWETQRMLGLIQEAICV